MSESMFQDRCSKRFPVMLQLRVGDVIYILLVCIDRKDSICIFRASKILTVTFLFGKFIRCFEEIILERFRQFVYGVPGVL